jgi:hypothetical protein
MFLNKISKLIMAAFLMLPLTSFGQLPNSNKISHYNAEKVVPQSPEVASLSRYGKYPVNCSSGLVDISIPLYTIKTKQLELPISISYHSSGIKVNEISSNIGLGWTLNAGGMVSVDVKGYGQDNSSTLNIMSEKEIDSLLLHDNKQINSAKIRGYLDNCRTTGNSQADLFSYSVSGGISGSFMDLPNRGFVQFPKTDNKIVYENYGYTITSNDGTKYVFGGENVCKSNPDTHSFVTSYLLSKIVSADQKDSITFYYRKVSTYYQYLSNFSGTKEEDELVVGGGTVYSNLQSTTIQTFYDMEIERIEFNGGKIVFSAVEDRKDLGMSRMARMDVYQIKGKEQKKIQTVSFKQGYFESADCHYSKQKYPEYFNRLKLKGVTFSCLNGEDRNFAFDYNGRTLPCYDFFDKKHTSASIGEFYCDNYAQDKAGYYNGKITNRHLIPYNSECSVDEFRKMTGVIDIPDMETDPNFSNACMLRSIRYPSGGYTSFTFESNGNVGGHHIKSIRSYDRNGEELECIDYSFEQMHDISVNSYISNSTMYHQKFSYKDYSAITKKGKKKSNPDILKYYTILSSSPIINSTICSSPVVFGKAIEYKGNSLKRIGKTEYYFDIFPNKIMPNMSRSGSIPRYKYRIMEDNFWKRGDIIQKNSYDYVDGEYRLVQSVNNQYTFFNEEEVLTGLVVTKDNTEIIEGTLGVEIDKAWLQKIFDWFETRMTTADKKLTKTITTNYNGEKSITETMDYEYGKIEKKNGHQQITCERKKIGNSQLSTYYFYPQDYVVKNMNNFDGRVVQSFCSANIVNKPFEVLDFFHYDGKTDVLCNGTFFRYSGINKLTDIYRLIPNGSTSYTGATEITDKGYNYSNQYEREIHNIYNMYNCLAQTTDKSGVPTSYLWGYNSLYPVAQIQNATIESVDEKLRSIGMSAKGLTSCASVDTCAIRTALNNIPNSHTYIYDYEPLLGNTLVQLPNKVSQTFSLDGASRLLEVKKNGCTTSVYSYHETPEFYFDARLDDKKTYTQYDNASFCVDVINGSGNYDYKWELLQDNKILYSSNKENFEVYITESGNMQLTCCISDKETGKEITVNKNIEILRPAPMIVSDITYQDSVLRVDGNYHIFDINVSEGSGNNKREWYMNFGNEKTILKEYEHAFRFYNTGTYTIGCRITDTNTGEVITKERSVKVEQPEPIKFIEINGQSNTLVGTNTYSAVIKNGTGSGDFSYVWTLTKSDGKIITATSSNIFTSTFDVPGTYILYCNITDNFNKQTITKSMSITVKDVMTISDETITSRGNKRTLKCKLYSPCDCEITVEYGTDRPSNPRNNDITYIIGTNRYYMPYYMTGTETKKISVKKGNNDIEISFDVLEGNSHRICNWINILQVPENIILGNGTVSMNVL